MGALIKPQLAMMRARYGRLTQSELSKRTGITQKQLSALERGKAKGIEFGTLAKLCAFFDCSAADLLAIEFEPDLYAPPTPEELAKAHEIISRAMAHVQSRPVLSREEAISELNAALDAVSAELNREPTGDQC